MAHEQNHIGCYHDYTSSTFALRSFKKKAADDFAAVGSVREGQGRRIRSEEEEKKGD